MKKIIGTIITSAIIFSTNAVAGVAFKSGELKKPFYTLCFYDYMGSSYQMTVDSTQFCPLTINVN